MGRKQIDAALERPSPLAALRLATAGPHARIEGVLALEQPFTLSHYARVLRGFSAFLQAWEPAVARALPERLVPWFDARRRGPLLARDLAVLRIPQPAPAPLALRLEGLPAALGSLYVLEGSALGGQVIAPRLRQWHGLGAHDGAAYFWGWGERTGAMWREFRTLLDAELGTCPQARAAACAAAAQTFDALIGTFETELHEPLAA